jgi:hypothetical protein
MILPHHIPYPLDDVVVGSWVNDFAPKAEAVHDLAGFHDPPEHGWKTFPVTYESVCIHHVDASEMRTLRAMEEWEGEFDEL